MRYYHLTLGMLLHYLGKFFYFSTFAINLWHRKFVTADVTAVFVNNQRGIQRRGQDFDKACIWRGTQQRDWQTNFFQKSWTQRGVNKLLEKLCDRATKHYHTITGSFSQPPTFYQSKYLCLRMRKYFKYSEHINTLSIHSYMRRGIKIGALKMQFICIFSISAEHLQKIWIFNFPR